MASKIVSAGTQATVADAADGVGVTSSPPRSKDLRHRTFSGDRER